MITMLNCDCMEFMAGCKDKQFSLAIVDPPYVIGMELDKDYYQAAVKRYETHKQQGFLFDPKVGL